MRIKAQQIAETLLDDPRPIIVGDKVIKGGLLTCPHCKQEVFEKHSYVDERGVDRHSDCGGAIRFPPPSPSEQKWLDQLLQTKRF